MKQYQTIKIWKNTLSNLHLLAGLKEQSIVKILDILVKKALELENEYRYKHTDK